MFRKLLLAVFASALMAATAWARATDTGKPVKVITDADLTGASNLTWYPDTVYHLHGFVFLESGGRLTILPGTIIKGDTGQASNATALIICRGARCYANGTQKDPIIMTSVLDTVDSQTDIGVDDKGLWGGLLICGKASISDNSDGFRQDHLEGIPLVGGLPDPRTEYGAIGGDTTTIDNNDTSGSLSYVSIRHPGSVLEANVEINGLSLGGVGRGTHFDHIETYCSNDDGIEWFGGTVDMKYIIDFYGDDDGFDTDEGYSGRNQFMFRLMSDLRGNKGNENDGAEAPPDVGPFGNRAWANQTLIGPGCPNAGASYEMALIYRDNCPIRFRQNIVTDFSKQIISFPGAGAQPNTDPRMTVDTAWVFTDNIWWKFGCHACLPGAMDTSVVDTPTCVIARARAIGDALHEPMRSYFQNGNKNNREIDPQLTSYSRPHFYNAHTLNPRPRPGSPAASGYPGPDVTEGDPWFTHTTYAGGVSPDSMAADGNWLCGWTAISQYGFLTEVRGDLNNDYSFTPADVVIELNVVFLGSQSTLCKADTNCDGSLTPSDVVNELNWVFLGTLLPCA